MKTEFLAQIEYTILADAARRYSDELVRVYGKEILGRYRLIHPDANLQAAKDGFIAASATWHNALNKARTKERELSS